MLTFSNETVFRALLKAASVEDWGALNVIMQSLASQYLEGEDEVAGKVFNATWGLLPSEGKLFVINHMVFESCANSLATQNNLPLPYEKIGDFEWKYVGQFEDPRKR